VTQIWIESPDVSYLDGAFADAVKDEAVSGVMLDPTSALDAVQVRAACDHLTSTYERKNGGYVVLSLDPILRDNARRMVSEATKQLMAIDRPNVMIALPATKAGLEAMATLSESGKALCATHVFSSNMAMQAAEALRASPFALIVVSVSPFDRKLNPILKSHNLAQNRIGFFEATKMYNQISALGYPNLQIAYAKMDGADVGIEPSYYVENLTHPGTIHFLSPALCATISEQEIEESFHFQTRHIDAFFGFLAPAGIALSSAEEELFLESFAS
jgi:transaldolase